ncbi:uncharacterized protein LOC111013524 isoform X2 [Momordica charantia]|uniref:Uncharacterized protein LOC111013524 isoform X2 n=1 Tax=Momordica charantia TaxID=3673 RepID=A0A6J1CPG1_MOMCH|nr:uncharacterized protein LOC111013524 isoform X2 [Momordica charantia]
MNKKTKKKGISWQEKKDVTDQEQILLRKDLDQLKNWIQMVDSMNDEQLKDYLHNRPKELKTLKIQQSNSRRRRRKIEDPRYWASYGIMASVWKFHKQDNNDQLLP